MTLRQLWNSWNNFWFAYGSPIPIALFRLCVGLLVLTFYWWISPEAATFFGQHAITQPATVAAWMQSPTFDLLSFFPKDDIWLHALLWILVVCGVCLTVGILSRPSAFLIYLILLSLDSRNHFVLNSGIGILCDLCLFLVFSKCGEALSLKRLLAVWDKDPVFGSAPDVSLFAQRLVQVQLCLVYWAASGMKLNGHTWLEGTAIFYTTQLLQFQRFSVPYVLDHLWTSRLMSWATLLFEGVFPILIWIKEFRYLLLAVGVIFHLGMDWVLVIPLFQEVMIACYICFIEASDLTRVMTVIKNGVRVIVKEQLQVVYDGKNNVSIRVAETLRRLDILSLLSIREASISSVGVCVQDKQVVSGIEALRRLAPRLPLLLPLTPLFWIPGFEYVLNSCAAALNRTYCNSGRNEAN